MTDGGPQESRARSGGAPLPGSGRSPVGAARRGSERGSSPADHTDDQLRELHRRALADPRDVEARAAYGQALLRCGLHAAACHELTVAAQARAWATSRWDHVVAPRPGAPDVRLGEWRVELAPFDPKAVAPPDVPDARWPQARLQREGQPEWVPLALVPPPACAAPGCHEGAVTCTTCGGRGRLSEDDGGWSAECHGCDGLGTSPCSTCDGTGLDPARRDPAPGCRHEVGLPEWTGHQGWSSAWALVRCAGCGLAALRTTGADDLRWACGACGRFRCDCARS